MKSRGLVVLSTLLLATTAFAADTPKETKANVLLTEALPDVKGKEVVMLTVEYPPGASSAAHRHNADVFVYVLSGSVIMQVDGKEPVTLTVGQTFHEKPTDIHRTSANASKTEPAKFLVFFVKDKGVPATTPVTQ